MADGDGVEVDREGPAHIMQEHLRRVADGDDHPPARRQRRVVHASVELQRADALQAPVVFCILFIFAVRVTIDGVQGLPPDGAVVEAEWAVLVRDGERSSALLDMLFVGSTELYDVPPSRQVPAGKYDRSLSRGW